MLATLASMLLWTSPPTALPEVPPDLSPQVLSLAVRAYERARAVGHAKKAVLAIIDYSKPSTAKRLWVLDIGKQRMLFHELVAHGRGSGEMVASRFSNVPGSLTTSLGVFVTGQTYFGKHGLSLKLKGLEDRINDEAESRAIVIHGADYVAEGYAKKHGRLGRSWGCPAVSSSVAHKLIESMAEGTVLFSFYPDDHWLSSSAFLR